MIGISKNDWIVLTTLEIIQRIDQMCIRWVAGITMMLSYLEPGLHNITVKTKNIEGGSPGELVYVTYETFEVVILPVLHHDCFDHC